MDIPVEEIEGVIRQLCQGSPKEQENAINTYFTPDAEFIHPFIRTWSFQGSRWLILKIYQWYKIMSPNIEMTVNGIGKSHPYSYMMKAKTDMPQRSTRRT